MEPATYSSSRISRDGVTSPTLPNDEDCSNGINISYLSKSILLHTLVFYKQVQMQKFIKGAVVNPSCASNINPLPLVLISSKNQNLAVY